MLDAELVAVADAVVEALNDATLSQDLAAERAYVPVHTLKELAAGLKVTVVPAALTASPLSRRDDDFDYLVDVGIQRKLDGVGPDDVDPLMLLAQEIVDLFRNKPLGETGARCMRVANAPVFDPASLDERRVFVSVISLTFRKARAGT